MPASSAGARSATGGGSLWNGIDRSTGAATGAATPPPAAAAPAGRRGGCCCCWLRAASAGFCCCDRSEARSAAMRSVGAAAGTRPGSWNWFPRKLSARRRSRASAAGLPPRWESGGESAAGEQRRQGPRGGPSPLRRVKLRRPHSGRRVPTMNLEIAARRVQNLLCSRLIYHVSTVLPSRAPERRRAQLHHAPHAPRRRRAARQPHRALLHPRGRGGARYESAAPTRCRAAVHRELEAHRQRRSRRSDASSPPPPPSQFASM